MSNIYIQEPPSDGKVLLETTVGDIDIELWSREAPKATRNFIQLCMEGYYNGTVFHRLVKGFIVQGGDPTGTGTGGVSVWGNTFKDEFHSRLRFVRRGLVAMANAGKDDNGSQFFFTLGATPELQNKHTIFGKVAGDTIYNMIKLEEAIVDEDERPLHPHKIIRTKILSNPFPDIVPRQSIASLSKDDKKSSRKSATPATKNFTLLSFGEEAEEEEEAVEVLNKKFSGKSKSSHDLTQDPKLSSEAVVVKPSEDVSKGSSSASEDEAGGGEREKEEKKPDVKDHLNYVKEKLKKKDEDKKREKSSKAKKEKPSAVVKEDEDDEEEYYLGKEDKLADKKRLDGIRKEYKQLKRSMKEDKEVKEEEESKSKKEAREKEEELAAANSVIQSFLEEQKAYKEKKNVSKKGGDREAQTLALLAKFKNKIETAKESFPEEEVAIKNVAVPDTKEKRKDDSVVIPEMLDDEEDMDDISWLAKSLHKDGSEVVVAKDANRKTDDWFEIYDPRNPLNKRRREESKQHEKIKKLKPID